MDSNNVVNEEMSDKEVPQTSDNTIQSDNDLNSDSIDGQMSCETNESNDCQKSASDETMDKENRYQYSKDELIAISKQSLARIRPKCLDNTFNNPTNGLWNPEKWMSSRAPTVVTANNKHNKRDGNENCVKKANNDLKDKVIEEENNIILSPQRGSFGTGCHVSATISANKPTNDYRSRDHFNDRLKDDANESHRMNRRIGTGRIVPKERERSNDYSDRNYDRDRDRGYDQRNDGRMDGRNSGRMDNRDDDYSDRRNRNRFFDRRENMPVHRNRYDHNERKYRDNRYSREEEEEPEWFTEGPISKHDTIELKGFDDDSEHRKDMKQYKDKKSSEDTFEEKNDYNKSSEETEGKDKNESKLERSVEKRDDFDVNELFKTDEWFNNGYQTPDKNTISSMDGISENAVKETESNGKSRFNRWFKGSPVQPSVPQMSDNSQINVLKDSNNCQTIEGKVTAPQRSLATNHMSNAFSSESNERKIFDLLKGSSNRLSFDASTHKLDPKRALSVSEIEANLKQLNVNHIEEQQNQIQAQERKAFEKFFNELSKKSSQNQNSNVFERVFSDPKSEATIYQTNSTNIVIPKSANQQKLTAPSLMELLNEEENKERIQAMAADAQRNARRFMNNQTINQSRSPQNGSHVVVVPNMSNNNISMNSMQNSGQTGQDWQLMSSLMKTVRPSLTSHSSSNRMISNQEVTDNTNFILQNAYIKRQQMDPQLAQGLGMRAQMNDTNTRTNTPIRGMSGMTSNSNFLTPTSVMRKMNCDKDRDLVNKTNTPLNEMLSEPNTSQKYINDQLIAKPSPQSMRPIVKSNSIQSPLSPQSESKSFLQNPEPSLNSFSYQTQQQLLLQQQLQQQNSPLISHQRLANASNAGIRSFSLSQNPHSGAMTAGSPTPAPNAMNNQFNQNMLQMFNQSTVRPNVNQMSINQSIDGRLSQQYSGRPMNAPNVNSMLKHSNPDPFKSSMDRNMMSESEQMKALMGTTYPQMRSQMFANTGHTDSRFLGQLFGAQVTNQGMPNMPPVPLQNALTLDDIERP